MVSKKVIAPTVAGTGAAGAAGTMAWTLGLFDGGGLDDVVKDAAEVDRKEKAPSNPAGSEKQSREKANVRIAGPRTGKEYLASESASIADKQIISNKSWAWEVKWNEGLESITVQIKDSESFSWECRLKAIVMGRIDDKNDFSEFERQRAKLEKALKDEGNREQFVANCSRARTIEENSRENKTSIIELEAKEINWRKFKFKEKEDYFERLWTEDFTGVDRLSAEDENIVQNETNWNISGEKGSGTKGKATIFFGNSGSTCHISGDYGKDLGEKTFKDDDLKNIWEMNKYNEKKEKKKYLIRNCRKNNMAITGLKIKVFGSNWRFEEESLKKISEGMYENPVEVEPQGASPQ